MNYNNQPRTAKEIISDTVRSDEFLRARNTNKDLGGVALLSVAAKEVADRQTTENNGYDTPEIMQRRLISMLPSWLKSQKELDLHRDEMTRAEKRTVLEPVVEFNHILRTMIDNEVYTSMPEITQFTQEALLEMRASPHVLQYAKQQLRGVVDGMRHEIASESVLSDLPDVYDVRQGEGIDDEMRGRDIYVEYKGEEIALDIKSRPERAAEANARSSRSDYVAIWSGFEWEDFGNSLVPSKEQIAAKRAYWTAELARLHGEGTTAIAI